MIKTLKELDPKKAAGVLARAALSLGYETKADNQITDLLREVRDQLGIEKDDQSLESTDRIAQFLDAESDRLLAPPDIKSALTRLAERGDLPSDLYEINIISNVADIYGKRFELEKEIIETTIRSPNTEQHYGAIRNPNDPALVSLFVKQFRTRWPLKNFIMLVAAGRNGLLLEVHQAWRIYPLFVNIAGIQKPIDLLKAFANVYGADISIENETGRFFLFLSRPGPTKIEWHARPNQKIILSRFVRNDHTGREDSALVVAIDIKKYTSMLDDMWVRREDMIDEFVPAPRPQN